MMSLTAETEQKAFLEFPADDDTAAICKKILETAVQDIVSTFDLPVSTLYKVEVSVLSWCYLSDICRHQLREGFASALSKWIMERWIGPLNNMAS